MAVEAVTPVPPREVGRTVFTQTWADLMFVHWAVEPERVRPYLPAGVRPDTFDGKTYVGLIPFRMRRIGLLRTPGLPYLGSFLETNVRLYSVDRQGRRGVVFVSLDATRLLPVLAARLGPRLPYLWSSMGYRREGDRITYTCARRPWAGPLARSPVVGQAGVKAPAANASSRVSVTVGPRIPAHQVGELEHWMTARWGLHLSRYYWPNAHGTWPLHRARLDHLDDGLLSAAGFGDLATKQPDSVMFSPGVHSVFGPRTPAG